MGRAGIAWAAAPRVTRVVWLPGGTTNLAVSSNERGGPYLATEERHGHVFGHTVRHVVQSHLHLIAHAGTVRLAHEATGCWREGELPNNQFCKIHHLHTQPSISPARAQGLEGATATLGEMHSATSARAYSGWPGPGGPGGSRGPRNTRGRAILLTLFLGLARQSLGNKKVPLYPPCIMGYHIPTSGGNCTACAQGKFGLGDYT